MNNISDLHDYSLASWVLQPDSWQMIFDSENAKETIELKITGLEKWRLSNIGSPCIILDLQSFVIDKHMLDNRYARESWRRILSFYCSDDDIVRLSQDLIKEHSGEIIITFETPSSEFIDLICKDYKMIRI